MDKSKTVALFLIGFFLLSLFLRWYVSFSLPYFSGDSAYFHLRHIDYLLEHFRPMFFDNLSWGGRVVLYPPLFHIILALLSFGNMILLKALPELFISCLIFVAYLLGYELTKDTWAAAWGAILAGFFPLLFVSTVNTLSLQSLFLPLFFLLLYVTLRLHEAPVFLHLFIALVFVVGLLSSLSILFVLTALLYILLLSGNGTPLRAIKKEALLFATLFIVLCLFLVYKRAFFAYGLSTLYYNIPATLLANTFAGVSASSFFSGIGLLPLLLGTFGLYYGVFFNRQKPAFLLSALLLSVFLLLSLRLISFVEGLLFFGVALGIMSSLALSTLFPYLQQTRFSSLLPYKHLILLGLFFLFSFFPTVAALRHVESVDADFVLDLQSLSLREEDVIAGSIYDGNIIAYFAQCPTIVDSSFLLAPRSRERVQDIATLYTTTSSETALALIEKYSIDYLVVSDATRQMYDLGETISYAKENPGCFSQEGSIYAIRC